MDLTQLSPDEVIWWQSGWVKLNATIVFTWVVMAVMIAGAWLATRRLTTGTDMPKVQNAAEVVVEYMLDQIRQTSGDDRPRRYLPFVGTLFLFIATSTLLSVVPGFVAPTASLSTTAALATAVFVSVPVFAVARDGVRAYARHYLQPSPIMVPFNLMGDLSRTVALAIRLFGNMMSAAKIAAILVAVIPLVFPVLFQALGLLTGMVQAYIFAVLAMVYIASGAAVTTGSGGHSDREQRRA